MPRQKKCRHRADGEECLLTFPFIGQGRRRISAFRVTKQSTKLRRLSKTTRSRVHVQTVGLNAETKKVSAPSRRGRMSLDIPFYRTFPITAFTRHCVFRCLLFVIPNGRQLGQNLPTGFPVGRTECCHQHAELPTNPS